MNLLVVIKYGKLYYQPLIQNNINKTECCNLCYKNDLKIYVGYNYYNVCLKCIDNYANMTYIQLETYYNNLSNNSSPISTPNKEEINDYFSVVVNKDTNESVIININ